MKWDFTIAKKPPPTFYRLGNDLERYVVLKRKKNLRKALEGMDESKETHHVPREGRNYTRMQKNLNVLFFQGLQESRYYGFLAK